ncbi:MAG TPA: AarF/UbiB family protein [Pseudogracilibacillus sp.]|nr:AarF/UbiB family protein [Pseudogracilibacillus sp.]
MIYAIFAFILFSFIGYRLIGVKASFMRRIAATVLSLLFTSAIFYVFHLRSEDTIEVFTHFDHYSFLYFITLVVVSLGFSLILEMMREQDQFTELDRATSTLDKMRYFISTRLRYTSLIFIITKNGLLRTTFRTNSSDRNQQVAVAFKNTLEKAGGIFVKFGQFLSTRSDLFPSSFLEELSSLQEKVYPVSVTEVREIIEEQLQHPIDHLFQYFENEPIAAASMAQVHKAILRSGEEVIVKVLRPRLKKQMAIDIHILTNFSKLLTRKVPWARRIGIVDLTEGFIQNLYEEVDFSVELNNMKQMKKLRHSSVYIPKAYEEYCTSEIVVMELLEGVSIKNINAVVPNNQKKQQIINNIFQEMLVDIFDYGLFHGDPHPGNIFILKNENPAFIDFGSVGRLSSEQRAGFRWLLIGINRKNAESMLTGIKQLVVNYEQINTKQLKLALSQFLMEHSFEGNIMNEMGKELFDMMGQFGLRFFPDVAGAFRTVITLQGSLQTIGPEFNLNEAIDTYLKNLLNVQSLTDLSLNNLEEDILNFIPKVRDFPKKIDNIVEQVENGKITFRMSLFSDEDNVKFVNSFLSLFFTGLTGFALGLLALGSLFLGQAEDPNNYSFLDVFGYSGLALSVTMLVRVAIQSLKRKQ